MKRILIATLLLPLLMSTGCKDETGGGKEPGPVKEFPQQIPSTDKFPVVAWHGVRSSHASVERFQQAEAMGITIDYSRRSNVENALRVLDIAAQTDIKLIIECDEIYDPEKRVEAVKALMGHKALAGYFMSDEPHPVKFPTIAATMKQIQAVDKEHICYCNLLPTGGPEHYEILGVKDYTEYVTRYLDECPTTFLSFDKYPIAHNDIITWVQDNWYEALEVTAREARKRNMELWTFLMTVPHGGYPQPTLNHLRLQGYSNLAYGSQVLQCFTYWTPDPSSGDYRNGPINADGTVSPTYDLVKSYLTEMQKLAWIFRGCEVEGVWHLSSDGSVPVGTTALTKDNMPEMVKTLTVSLGGESALASVLTNHGYTFLIVQNTNVNKNARSGIELKEGARFVDHDGKISLASEQNKIQIITPGDIRVYMW